MGELLPVASYKSKGLCSTNISKQSSEVWRGDVSGGYIQIAKVKKSEVYGLNFQLMLDIISTYNNFGEYVVCIAATTIGVAASILTVKDDPEIKFYYKDDGDYLYLFCGNINNHFCRKLISAPNVSEYIGDISYIKDPGSLNMINK